MFRTTITAAAVTALLVAAPAGLSAQYQDGHMAEKGGPDIVEVAANAGSFATLLKAAEAAGLVGTLQGDGPFTVFAPTDEAFAALPAGTLESLLAAPEKLAEILTYHVVPGRIEASDVIAAGSARPTTVQGEQLNVRVVDGSVLVDGATVIQPDIEASNGIIHVIDAVVLPGN